MTQQKTRATTLQQKFGFQDPDLTSPAHDALMVWLDQNVEEYVLSRFLPTWKDEDVDSMKSRMLCEVQKHLIPGRERSLSYAKTNNKNFANDLSRQQYADANERLQEALMWTPGDPPKKKIEVIDKIWESPIMSNKFMVGFVDMKVTVETVSLSYVTNGPAEWNFPEWQLYQQFYNFLFEIKPSIPSVGELIRQVRMYQQYEGGQYIVVSPDDRFASVLAGQKIGFLKAPKL